MTDQAQHTLDQLNTLIHVLAHDEHKNLQRPFSAPNLLPAVLGDLRPFPQMALDSGNMMQLYSYLNQGAFCGMGFPGYQYLAQLTQRSEYRAPAETIATEAFRRGFELVSDEGDKADTIKELHGDIEEFQVCGHLERIVQQDSFFGRGQLCVNLKGQENRTQIPLLLDDRTNIKGKLDSFNTIEAQWTTPLMWNATDPSRKDFYRPQSWAVLGKEWHSTKLLTFIAREVPDMLKPAYNFGGISMSQLIEPYVVRWLKSVDSGAKLLSNFSRLVLKTTMQNVLANDKTAAQSLVKRAELYNQMADNRGILLMDKNTEDLGVVVTPLSGIHELMAQMQEHMSAPTHIPLVKLFGITPTGLNASSEGEIKVYYDWVQASTQKCFLGPNLDTIVKILQLNRYGKIDPSIKVRWFPLDQPNDHELAQIRKSDADADAVYITNGVIAPEESRQRLQDDPNSGYDNLTGPPPAPPHEQQAELDEEGKQADHERGEESAEAGHERAIELEKIKSKGKPKA